MTTSAPIVELAGVSKRFGDRDVLDDLSLTIAPGQVFGLIGPSGCGKSTLVRVLLGLLAPSSGQVRVLGKAPGEFTTKERERIGYTPQGFVLYPTLTVAENASFVAGLYGVSPWRRGRRIREVLQFLELGEARRRLARDISGGMQRRLALACALIHRPDLLIVDEPTAGLDPLLRQKIWDHLRHLCDGGVSVIVTTQYIDEATYCDRLAVLTAGQVAAVGTPDELRRSVSEGEVLELEADDISRAEMAALWDLPMVRSVRPTGPGRALVTVAEAAAAIPAVTAVFQQGHGTLLSVTPHVPSFDDIFLTIVNRHAA